MMLRFSRVASARCTGAVALRAPRAQRPFSTKALLTILTEEIENEGDVTQMPEDIVEQLKTLALRGATLEHAAGNGCVKITLKSGAVASFDCRDVQSDMGEEEDMEESPMPGTEFEVAVTNLDGHRMIFECVAAEGVQIDGVSYFRKGADDKDEDVYDGPKFDELDPRLQQAFYSYLEDEQGVDPELVALINQFAGYKESVEYAGWLGNIKSFVDVEAK